MGWKLDDFDLGRIHAVLLQDHLEQIDIGLGAADHADAASGKLHDLGDLRRRLLAFDLGRRRHPQHGDVLAQCRHRLGIFRHVEIAADDGEIGLALRQRLGARPGAIGLHRAQTDLAARRDKGLRQGLDHLDVFAVGRADRDPQRHRAHRKVIGRRDRADHGEQRRQHDEHQAPFRRARRRRCRRLGQAGFSARRPRKQSFGVQIHPANVVKSTF